MLFLAWLWDWLVQVFSPRPVRRSGRELRYDLFLTTGVQSIKLFEGGPLDVLRFFHRHTVSRGHDLEYLSFVRPSFLGHERYQPYGLFRIRDEEEHPLPTLEEIERELSGHYGHGLIHLPDPSPLLGGRRYGLLEAGYNWIKAAQSEEEEAAEEAHGFSTADMLQIIRNDLPARHRIAWIEGAFMEELPEGDVAHRYYFDRRGDVWLVRHHWHHGKSLYQAETSHPARQAVKKHTPVSPGAEPDQVEPAA